ncbi:MAG TPA: glycine cleavage system protein GcvH [Pirellulaceae bacterium]|jgi:glycine cleavage system H protein|nr:glycine cleavage system protein GcvH [Pirellulaceae bacterium]
MKREDLLYAETHEWAAVEPGDGGKVATVGITDFAVEQLTDLVFMDLPPVGKQVEAGKEFGEVESVKAVSPLYSPVSGEIVAVNSDLPSSLETLNSDPFGAGWMIKVKLSDETGLKSLLTYDAYKKQISESH